MRQIGPFYVLTKAEHGAYHPHHLDKAAVATQKREGWGVLYLSSGQTGSIPCLYPTRELAAASGLEKSIIAHAVWEE